MFTADRPSWQNPKILSVLLVVFATGAMTGALCMRLGLHERLHASPAGTSLKDPKAMAGWRERCKKELSLSDEQAQKLDSILDDYKLYYQSLQDQIEEVRATGKSRIMQVLNSEQKAKFEKLLNEAPH